MIELKDLSYTYKGQDTPALQNVNLKIEKGDFVGIIGESGAGKSTLAYTINGIIPHHFQGDFYGQSRVNGLDTFETSLEDLSKITGSIFQDIDGQMVATLVEDEVMFGLENFGISKDEALERLDSALKSTGIEHLRHRSIHSLSGGQKQKVALSAILALRPRLLVLDEPTGELDPASSLQIFQLLKKLNREQGITIVVIEQKIMLLCEFVKSLVVMKQGKIVLHDSVRQVLRQSLILEETGVNCPRINTLASRLESLGLKDDRVCLNISEAKAMVTAIAPMPSASYFNSRVQSLQSGIPLITFDHVTYQYNKKESIIKDVSFEISKGDFIALTGSNGAGKSTLTKLFNGLLLPLSGTVTIDGQSTLDVRTSDLARKIGFLFQNPDTQICQNTVKEEILFGLRCLYKSKSVIQQKYDAIANEFKLKEDADPFNLSRGERQIAALASVLAAKPEILILDEPTTGLDYVECMHIMNIIKRLNQQGTTIIMVSHDMELVLDFARSVLILHNGTILAHAPVRTAFLNTAAMSKASLLPPQIARLAMELGADYEGVFTVDEMLERMGLQ